MAHFNEEYHQMNGYQNHRPTENGGSPTSSGHPRSRSSNFSMTNPHGYHGSGPPPPHYNSKSEYYSQWTTRGRDTDLASRERYDDGIPVPGTQSSPWTNPYDEISPRYSTTLDDYYYTPPYHHSTHGSSGHSYHHPPRSTAAPPAGHGYGDCTRGADIFRPRDSYSTPRGAHTTAASPSPPMVTPTRALHPEDTSKLSFAFAFPNLPSSPHQQRTCHSHYHGLDDGPRSSINDKGRRTSSSFSSQLIWHLHENDIVCGRGAPSLFQRGNQTFRELIQEQQTVYLCSKRSDKPRLAWKIFDLVTSRGGRFVRRNKVHHQNHPPRPSDAGDDGGDDNKDGHMPSHTSTSSFAWEQLTDKQAYEKICQSLREGAPELRRRLLQKVKKQRGQQDGREDDGGKDTSWPQPSSPPDEARKDRAVEVGGTDEGAVIFDGKSSCASA